MSWSERLDEIRKKQETGQMLTAKTDKSPFDPFVSDREDHSPEFSRMPSPADLLRVCRLAVVDYPTIDAARLQKFLEVAQDPTWCSERVARLIARRMSEGVIQWPR